MTKSLVFLFQREAPDEEILFPLIDLFILYVEGLKTLLNLVQNVGIIHGCKIARSTLVITHLLFANDSYLFFKVNIEETSQIKCRLHHYELASG